MFRSNEDAALEERIAAVHETLKTFSPEDEEYRKALDALERLYKIKTESRSSINPNTALVVFGAFAQVVAIIGYERAHVFVSRAQNFIMKPS